MNKNITSIVETQEERAKALAEDAPIRSEESLKAVRKNFNILLAEDNLINQKVSLKILHASGYNASAVSNGAEAVESIQNEDYDLILMDIQMPEVDGFSATAQIRRLENEKGDVPIIALTAHALMGDREKCLSSGMNEYLSKPIIARDLLAMIDRLLDLQNVPLEKIPEAKQVDSSLFDFERLKKVSADDFEFEKDLLSSYIEDIESKYKQLEDYVEAKDAESIIDLAHTIKGASYSVGAQKVGDEAFGIEISGKSRDLISVEERLPQFKNALEETKTILSEFLVSAE